MTSAVAWPDVRQPDGGVYPDNRPAVLVAPRVPVNPPSAAIRASSVAVAIDPPEPVDRIR